jgi:hypothetical protein
LYFVIFIVDYFTNFLTARTIDRASIASYASSSSGLPLLGSLVTASDTMGFLCSTKELRIASPIPPSG